MEGNEEVWKSFMVDANAEENVPELPGDEEVKQDDFSLLLLRRLILIKILRPDRFTSALKAFIHYTLKYDILWMKKR